MGFELSKKLLSDEEINNVLHERCITPLKKFNVTLLHCGYNNQYFVDSTIEANWYETKYGVLSFYKDPNPNPFKVFGPGFWISCEEQKEEKPKIHKVNPGPK